MLDRQQKLEKEEKEMRKLLQIDSSPSANSVTRQLTREFATAWREKNPGGEVIHRDLNAKPPAPIDGAWIGASYSDPTTLTPEQKATLAFSEELVNELEQADEYVFGVAMHNFSIPAVLKLWVDQVARPGRTFSYSSAGPQGLLQGKKATVLVASGGVYAPGTPMAAMDSIEPQLRTFLGFLGVKDVEFIRAGGTAKLMSPTVDRQEFLRPVVDQVRAAAWY
jgi:FMN-dependent NADH-azoreductase